MYPMPHVVKSYALQTECFLSLPSVFVEAMRELSEND